MGNSFTKVCFLNGGFPIKVPSTHLETIWSSLPTSISIFTFAIIIIVIIITFAIIIIIIIAIIRPQIGKNLDGQNVFIVFAVLTHMSSVRRVVHRYCHCRHCVSCENHKQHVFQAELRSYDGGVYGLNGSEANGWLDDAFSRICAMPMAR